MLISNLGQAAFEILGFEPPQEEGLWTCPQCRKDMSATEQLNHIGHHILRQKRGAPDNMDKEHGRYVSSPLFLRIVLLRPYRLQVLTRVGSAAKHLHVQCS